MGYGKGGEMRKGSLEMEEEKRVRQDGGQGTRGTPRYGKRREINKEF